MASKKHPIGKLLSEREVAQICLAAVQGTPRPVTAAEVQRAVEWAHSARLDATLLALVLRSVLRVRVDRPELQFRRAPEAACLALRPSSGEVA
jgi:hypothetical protein